MLRSEIVSGVFLKSQSQLTILVPSFERQKYLLRLKEYYKGSPYQIILLDGSSKPIPAFHFQEEGCENIQYLHSQQGFLERVTHGAKLIQTPYAALLSDDEFHLNEGLNACIDFLDKNSDYHSCIGMCLGFRKSNQGQPLFFDLVREELRTHILHQSSAIERMKEHMSNYVPSIVYSVMRSDSWKMAIQASAIPASCVHAPEIAFELVGSFLGKANVLSQVSWLRSYENAPISNASWNRKFQFHEWYFAKKFRIEKEQWLVSLKQLLQTKADRPGGEDIAFIESAIDSYNQKFLSKISVKARFKKNIKIRLKSIIPVRWREQLKTLLGRKNVEKLTLSEGEIRHKLQGLGIALPESDFKRAKNLILEVNKPRALLEDHRAELYQPSL